MSDVRVLGKSVMSDVRVLGNIGLMGAIGVLFCWWIGLFTDLLPAIGGLLGLGGVFAWLAFVSRVLTEERTKSIQQSFEKFVLGHPTTRWVLVGIAALLFLVSLFVGTLQIHTVNEPYARNR
jgi:membrane protease YdiL (CAAX protease family)